MNGPHRNAFALTLACITAVCAACSPHSLHAQTHGTPAPAHSPAKPAEPTTYRLADDGSGWKKSPHMREFYETSVAMLAPGTKVDVDVYEAKCFEIFRAFARAGKVPEEAMIDHLKLIPRQVVGIVKDDASVLKSYDAFWAAMVGPD